jgi:diphosphomevalonate decarboxylase
MDIASSASLSLMPHECIPGKVGYRSPSNIALVKYWGKREVQIPMNPSVSFTLSECFTETTLEYEFSEAGIVQVEFFFEGKPNPAFGQKIEKFLNSIADAHPYLRQLKLTIRSQNTFPHSAGIASSASAMSALCLCLCEMERELFGTLENAEDFNRKASYLSRLASGSACRSIYGGLVSWGKIHAPEYDYSSDLYGSPLSEGIHPEFFTYRDTVIICDPGEKSVSSRAGHALMNSNPFAQSRIEQANRNIVDLIDSMKSNDFDTFCKIVETEALTLHAMMMTSDPYFILMRPKTLEFIEKIWAFRKQTGTRLCFTLDAGPNIHLLYPTSEEENVNEFLQNEISITLTQNSLIRDFVGTGPVRVNM